MVANFLCLSCSKAVSPLLDNHTATPKNLAKPSTVASETHPSSFKQPRQHPTIQHGDPIFRWSRHRPRICRPNVSGLESFVARYSPRTCRRLSIVRTTWIDGTYYRPTIQHGYPIYCHSRHAPENLSSSRPKNLSWTYYSPNSVVIPLQPEFGRYPITAQGSVCFLGWTSKFRSHIVDVLFF